jgi:hypothetical protein
MARLQQLVADAAIPLGELELGAQLLLRLLLLQRALLPHVRAHDGVEVAVRLGAAGEGGGRRAIELARRVLCDLCYGVCALDVSLALLQRNSSETLPRTHSAEGGLTFGCLRRLTRRLWLLAGFSCAFAVRGTKVLNHESPSMLSQRGVVSLASVQASLAARESELRRCHGQSVGSFRLV